MMNQARLTLNETVPMDAAIIADPYPRYRQMREEDPVHWNQGINCWVLTRYTDGLAALRDQRLSSAQISAFSERLPDAAAEKIQPLTRLFSDIMSDPPNHTRLSKLANKAFTPRVVERMRSSIQATTDVLLDSIEKDGGSHGRFEVIKDLANPLPAIVISEMLGAANRDRERFSNPDRLDITKKDTRHLSFGFGPHFCLGSALARVEGQIVIGTVVQRWPGMQLAGDEFEWRYNPSFRILIPLPVAY